jgi:hypothetical protein
MMRDSQGWIIMTFAVAAVLLAGCDSQDSTDAPETPEGVFTDDFEATDCLGKWTVGGRRQEGTNTADCQVRNESTMGHLFKFSFTEITLSPDQGGFSFSSDLSFSFDMEVRVASTGGAPSAFYGSSGVRFDFLDAEGAFLGSVSYVAATTSFPFEQAADDSTRAAVQIVAGALRSHTLSMDEVLSHIELEPQDITTVEISFRTYSSTRPNPRVEAELWVDNVSVTRSG